MFSAPTVENLFLLILSILVMESANSIRFLYEHFVQNIENTIKSNVIIKVLKQLIEQQGVNL